MSIIYRSQQHQYLFPVFLFSALCLVAPATAADLSWDGLIGFDTDRDGLFNSAGNWNDGGAGVGSHPTVGDSAIFDVVDTYTVTFTQNEASDLLDLNGGDVVFLSNSTTPRTYSLTTGLGSAAVNGGSLLIGSSARPVFLDIADQFNIGTTANGAVTVDGPNSRLDALGPTHFIGSSHTDGSLTVSSGAQASLGTAGMVTIGSGFFGDGQGTILVDTGGDLFTGSLNIAPLISTSIGTVTVDGSGSSITQSLAGANLLVGSPSGGAGILNIQSGGTFSAGTGTTTIHATGTINLDGGTLSIENDSALNDNGGVVDFTSGIFELRSSSVLGQSFLNTILGGNSIGVGREVRVLAGGTVPIGLNVNGGTLSGALGIGGDLSITSGGTAVIGSLSLGSSFDSQTTTVEGAGSTLTTNFVEMRGTSAIAISGGGEVSSFSVRLGLQSDSPPGQTATISGTDGSGNASKWTITEDLTIGSAGRGQMTIQGGAEVFNENATLGLLNFGSFFGNGKAIVFGTDGMGSASKWINAGELTIGNAGTGNLTIDGGALVSNTNAYIGRESDSEGGTVTVSGAGSTWTNSGDLFVGGEDPADDVSGVLIIEANATVTATGMMRVRKNGTVIVSDSQVTITGLELASDAHFFINGGALTLDSSATIGISGDPFAFHAGTLRLTDAAGYTVGGFNVVDRGLGGSDINLANGANLIVDQALIVPNFTSLSSNGGDVSADTLTNDGFVSSINATITTANGTMNNADLFLFNSTIDGSVVNTLGSTVTIVGSATFNDEVSGPGQFFGPGAANFLGGFSSGASPAEIAFEGDVGLSISNTLFIELGGLSLGEFDRLDIAGDLSLAGELMVDLIGDFALDTAMDFIIAEVDGTLSGTFANLLDGALVGNFGGINLFIDYDGGDGNDVALISALPGDFDFDEDVDGFDFLEWQRGFGAVYDSKDLADWQTNYGAIAPLLAVSAAVPEPTSLLLLIGATLCCVCRRCITR